MANTSLFVAAILLGVVVSLAAADSGTATYYTTYVPSACYGNTDEGTMIAAASDAIWNGGAACGQTYTVTCTGATNEVPQPCNGNTVTVKVVDYCPPSGCGATIDLSREAFAAIANLVAGKINIDYKQVINNTYKLVSGVQFPEIMHAARSLL